MNYSSAEEIFNEMAALTINFKEITLGRLDPMELHWPCASLDHPGTPFLHKDRFSRGLGLFHAIEYRPSEELPDEEYPRWTVGHRRS